MDFQECIQFANKNPLCFLATADGDQPHVRTFLMWYADESGFYFSTLSPKAVSAQLKANPKVEVCFIDQGEELAAAKHMRVAGEIEMMDDPALIQKVAEERAFLSDLAGKPVAPFFEVFRIQEGDVHFWKMTDLLKERELEHLRFGSPEAIR